jgi:membrane-associated protease RseP (regulator of RpoE activity)
MIRPMFVAAVLIAVGAVAVSLWRSSPVRDAARQAQPRIAADRAVAAFDGRADRTAEDRPRSDLERRLALLEAQVARERSERQQLQAQLEEALAQLAVLGGPEATSGAAHPAEEPATAAAPAANLPESSFGSTKSMMERALAAAGVDAESAADIKRRHDLTTMNEMYLRDQATREQWLDTPRFAEEMSALAAEHVSIRDEIGDDAYDRYLFALGQPNRVRVDDVMLQSPAAQAGLQTGDMIVQYGDTRVFAPDELVAATRDGTAGETVRLEVIRNGERLEVDVPRGPLGLRIDAIQDLPAAG